MKGHLGEEWINPSSPDGDLSQVLSEEVTGKPIVRDMNRNIQLTAF